MNEKKRYTRENSRLTMNVQTKSEDDNSYVLNFIGSTEAVDRHGDVVESSWQLDSYKENPVFLWGHDHGGLPVGKALDVKVNTKEKRLEFKIKFAVEEYDFASTVYKLYRSGYLKATSVGFIPHDWDYDEEKDAFLLKDNELLELSAVTVPANPEALVMGFDKGEFSSKDLQGMEKAGMIDEEKHKESLKRIKSKNNEDNEEDTQHDKDKTEKEVENDEEKPETNNTSETTKENETENDNTTEVVEEDEGDEPTNEQTEENKNKTEEDSEDEVTKDISNNELLQFFKEMFVEVKELITELQKQGVSKETEQEEDNEVTSSDEDNKSEDGDVNKGEENPENKVEDINKNKDSDSDVEEPQQEDNTITWEKLTTMFEDE